MVIRFESKICPCNGNSPIFKGESASVIGASLPTFPQICLCNGDWFFWQHDSGFPTGTKCFQNEVCLQSFGYYGNSTCWGQNESWPIWDAHFPPSLGQPLHFKPHHLQLVFSNAVLSRRRFPCGIALRRAPQTDIVLIEAHEGIQLSDFPFKMTTFEVSWSHCPPKSSCKSLLRMFHKEMAHINIWGAPKIENGGFRDGSQRSGCRSPRAFHYWHRRRAYVHSTTTTERIKVL